MTIHLMNPLTAYYPTFHPILNRERKVCPDDYIYGYSLLMHFSCVKHPESRIQGVCEEMHKDTQIAIKTFLLHLMDQKSFSRETIKSAIQSSGLYTSA